MRTTAFWIFPLRIQLVQTRLRTTLSPSCTRMLCRFNLNCRLVIPVVLRPFPPRYLGFPRSSFLFPRPGFLSQILHCCDISQTPDISRRPPGRLVILEESISLVVLSGNSRETNCSQQTDFSRRPLSLNRSTHLFEPLLARLPRITARKGQIVKMGNHYDNTSHSKDCNRDTLQIDNTW